MSEGIKETKELLKFVIELGESVEKALEDKKIGIEDLGLLMAPLMQAGSAFEGMDKLGGELKDLSPEEMSELVAFAKSELDLEHDKIEAIVEAALDLGSGIYSFVKMFKKDEEVSEDSSSDSADSADSADSGSAGSDSEA